MSDDVGGGVGWRGDKKYKHCLFWMQGTLDVGLIDSVCASDNPDR